MLLMGGAHPLTSHGDAEKKRAAGSIRVDRANEGRGSGLDRQSTTDALPVGA
jgi:hypothetical protein